MKKIFLFLFLLLSVAGFSQIPRYTKIAHRYQWIAGVFDSTLHIPKGATPSLYTGGHTGSGALFYRTSDSSVYYYTGSQWLKVGSSALAFTTPLVNSSGTVSINGLSGYGSSGQLIRSNGTALEYFTPTYILAADTAAMLSKYMRNVFKKAGTDSVFKDVGGTISFAFIDSTGAGGSTLFPISGTGTATGTVTGDMNNNQLNINNATYIEIYLSDAYSISGNNGSFGTTNFFLKPDDTDIEYGLHSKSTFGGIREVGIRGFGTENTFYAIAAGDTSSVIIDANNPSITLDAFSVRFKDGSLGSASNGYVWKLIDSTTGEGGWVAESMEELKVDTTYERLMTLGTPNVLKSIDIVSGSNISVSKSVDTDSTLVFSVSSTSGEANTASNIGTAGVGLWKDKTGVDLRFKKINAGSNKVIITDDVGNNEVDIDIDATKFPVTLIDTTNVIRLATKIGTSPDSMVIKSVTFDYDAPVIASVDEDTDSSFTVRFSLDPEFTESVYRERYIQLLADDSNSTTTLANASNMWFEAEDSTMYEIEFTGAFQSAVTTTGIQMALDIPDGQVIGGMIAPTSNTAAGMVFQKADNAINGGTGTTGVATATSNTWVQAKWNYFSNAGGTVNLKYASEVGSSQVKLIKNISWMRVKKIKKY